MTTLVSAFITNINNYRSIHKYIEYGKKLLNIPIKKIIYMEKHIFDKYFENNIHQEHTLIRIIEKKDIYLYEHINDITEFKTNNEEKDTLEYMFVQCSKTEWIKNAIEENPYNSEYFVWLDFGIYHIMNNDEILFKKYVYNLQNTIEDKYVRIGSGEIVYNKNIYYKYYKEDDTYYRSYYEQEQIYENYDKTKIFDKPIWKFLGGIFGGSKGVLLKFSTLMKEKCLHIIKKYKNFCWEINIWFLLYKENPDLFSIYIADHDASMIIKY